MEDLPTIYEETTTSDGDRPPPHYCNYLIRSEQMNQKSRPGPLPGDLRYHKETLKSGNRNP